MHNIKRRVVTQPFIGGGKAGLPIDRGAPKRAVRGFKVVQRHPESGEMFDPVFGRFILYDAPFEEQHMHLVPVGCQPFGQVIIGRGNAPVAHWTDDFFGDDADPQFLLAGAEPDLVNGRKAFNRECVDLHKTTQLRLWPAFVGGA